MRRATNDRAAGSGTSVRWAAALFRVPHMTDDFRDRRGPPPRRGSGGERAAADAESAVRQPDVRDSARAGGIAQHLNATATTPCSGIAHGMVWTTGCQQACDDRGGRPAQPTTPPLSSALSTRLPGIPATPGADIRPLRVGRSVRMLDVVHVFDPEVGALVADAGLAVVGADQVAGRLASARARDRAGGNDAG